MSENLKKLREGEKKRKVAPPTILGKPWRTPKEFATKTTEELERKAEEVRKAEQKFKEEAKLLREEVLTDLKKLIIFQIQDEEAGVHAYEKMINYAKSIDLAENFIEDLQRFVEDERTHIRILNIMKESKFRY